MAGNKNWKTEPVAIVGTGCRFPGGANSPSKLWQLLRDPPDLQKEIPSTKFNQNSFFHSQSSRHGTSNVSHSYVLEEDTGVFDHGFFNINPKEAESMDPQQRILLETVYEAVESAGYTMSNLRGSSTGVFVGQMTDDYYDILNKDVQSAPQYTATGSSRAIIANRVSYFFDWRGPSVNVDTACSSSLVALHQAVQALRSGEVQLAVAAGVNLILGPEKYIFESQLSMLSPTGRSRMWDSKADGYARGEGFAAIVIKSLSQAIADNDHVECIIRETGVNQDGRSEGLTVPSSEAQAALIRSTYRKCGLAWERPEDRCQYFEAHGTGTQAGDPKEARAIRDAFFPEHQEHDSRKETLYVGSIKTVVGHLEGAAGLAGLIKAALAVQHGEIPPNLHFDRLNPKIEPFYESLEVPTRLKPWPELPRGVPRRASINSFGFGGTNAHAIIESWHCAEYQEISGSHQAASDRPQPHWGPFTLSAPSEEGLRNAVSNLGQTLKANPAINLRDLAWTLQSRRDHFPIRAAFAASDRNQLIQRFLDASEDINTLSVQISKAARVSDKFPARILGVFTGQGAQWPRMGAELYNKSSLFRQSIHNLQQSLEALADGPSWTLHSELLAPAESSHVKIAEIAQPICTAVQIALVDLLKSIGVSFHGVVGHSSGEIAAAYAAGYLSAHDSIRIAYYRGLHSHLASSPTGQPGKMMAVGLSFQEGQALCETTPFHGRVSVAASNAKSSITVSGDADAIIELKQVLETDAVFNRELQVDKAYHSHHMKPCSGAYLDSLLACNIKVHQTDAASGDCVWYSSVHGSAGRYTHEPDSFAGQYWVDNLVRPVMFSQALDRAVQESQRLDLVLEVGPHPALRGPASDLIKNLTGAAVPYSGVLKRGDDDIVVFSEALGFIWRHIETDPTARPMPDFEAFARACESDASAFHPQVCKSLPPFPWNHSKPLMWESRASKLWRGRQEREHELLGLPTVSGNRLGVHWRKVMRVDEMDWLRGHKFQNQVLFPAAGYVSMAIEAASYLVPDQPNKTRVIELNDMQIHRAITLSEQSSIGTEVTFIIHTRRQDATTTIADFSCFSVEADAGPDQQSNCNFTGTATIVTSSVPKTGWPVRIEPDLPLTHVDLDQFYTSVSGIGLDYSGDFVANTIDRRLGFATVTVSQNDRAHLLMDPAVLDTSFHGVFSAFCYPNDGRMWTAYLPTSIRRVRVMPDGPHNPQQQGRNDFTADCVLRDASDKTIFADVSIYSSADRVLRCQLEGLTCTSFTIQSPDQDRKLVSHTVWRKDVSCGLENNKVIHASHDDARLYEVLERTSYFYLRRLREKVPTNEIEDMPWHSKATLGWIFDRLLPSIEKNQHPRVKLAWEVDQENDILTWSKEFGDEISLRAVHAIGKAYPDIVRGNIPPLQILMEDDILDRLYKNCIGGQTANTQVGEIFGQLAHRYPKMKILEIGAGTGGTTNTAMKYLKSNFASYTYTDISPGFFEKAASAFSDYAHKMKFKTLDIEKDPVGQGFEEHSYDVIVAANVLHATKILDTTIGNCHKLLKPGGQMILLEITSEALWIQTIFSALPGWWLGQAEGRINHPTVSISEWEDILCRQGFSGVDVHCRDLGDDDRYTFSVFTTQALDDRVRRLRNPLSMDSQLPALEINHLTIIAPSVATPSTLVEEVKDLLLPFAGSIAIANGLEDPILAQDALPLGSTIVSLADLQEATFRNMDPNKFQTLNTIFSNSKTILWATRGCRADDPYANIMVGLGRSVMQELVHLNLQFVDLDPAKTEKPAMLLANMLLRMICADDAGFENVLWSSETETLIQDGHTYIPRIIPEEASNQRINSGRRTIVGRVNASQQAVTLKMANGSCWLEQAPATARSITDDGFSEAQVQVQSSSLFPVGTKEGGRHYVCIGKVNGSEETVLALVPTNSSIAKVPRSNIIHFNQSLAVTSGPSFLRSALVRIILESLIKPLGDANGTVWLHSDDPSIVEIACQITNIYGLELLWTAADSNRRVKGLSRTPRVIHPFITDRELFGQIPDRVCCLLTIGEEPIPGFFQRLASRLDVAQIHHLTSQANACGHITVSSNFGELSALIESASQSLIAESSMGTGICAVSDLVEKQPAHRSTVSHVHEPLMVVDWSGEKQVATIVKPLNTTNLFSDDKTYFLVGLTGELGVGLCSWMVDKGARHLALSSRNPIVDPCIIREWESKGAQVRIFALDVADEKMLHSVHQEMVATMPPVGGVMNGAMVLRDRPFSAMTLEDFEAVLAPKVRGSEYLDRLFHTEPLEFFILFSSLSRIIGNPGQSNYAAANMFMASLARQRRARGVAASVIDIAMLVGFGWMWRNAGEILEAQMKASAYMSISEPEFHTIMAEAIEAGRVDKGLDPEMHTGLAMSKTASWKRFPRFSHFVPSESQETDTVGTGAEADKTVKQQISEATSDEEILIALETAFSRKLRLVLQLADTGSPMDGNTALLSLGIDSLVAVELRSWFLKELAVDVPTLRILSDATIADISVEVKSKLNILSKPQEVDAGASAATTTDTPAPAAQPDAPSSASASDSQPGTPNMEGSPVVQVHHNRWLDVPSSLNSTASPSVAGSSADEGVTTKQESLASSITMHTPSYKRTGCMSSSQEALHFLHEYLGDKSSQNVLFHGRYPHTLNMSRLESAVYVIARRHEALRSAYFVNAGTRQAVQAVKNDSGIELIQKAVDNEADVDAEIQKLRHRVFDIASGKLMVIAIFSVSPTLHHLVFVHHHIAMDAQATVVFLSELSALYAGQYLSNFPPQAIDVCTKKQTLCSLDKLAGKLSYWKKIHEHHLSPIPLLPMARIRSRKPLYDYDLETFDVKVEADVCALIRSKSSELRITPFHFYLTTLQALLSRCLGTTEDTNIGIVDSNRGPDVQDTQALGCYINPLPLRLRLQEVETFGVAAQHTRDTVLGALSNAGVPFEMLLDQLKVPRSNTHHPLFQVLLNYRLGIPSYSPLGDGQIEWTGAIPAKNSYDLAVDVSDTPRGGCVLSFTTQRYMYSAADTKLLMKWYMYALKSFALDSSIQVSKFPLADPGEMRKAAEFGRGPSVALEWEGTLVDQVARIATQFPDSIAIKDDSGNQLSYASMMETTNQICRGLQESNIPPGSRVGVLLDPSIGAICTLLAVFWQGLVWVPLDRINHEERLAAIVKECQPSLIIYSDSTKTVADNLLAATASDTVSLCLENLMAPVASPATGLSPNLSKRDADALLLYTSGSTGVPKGVRLTHIGLLNQIYVLTNMVGERQVIVQQTSHGFDIALDQIFNALARGGTLVVVSRQGRGDPVHISKLMLAENVTSGHFVPSEWHMLLQYGLENLKQCHQWRFAHAAGEKISPSLRQAFRDLARPEVKLFDVYGPTETYISCARGMIDYQREEGDAGHLHPLPNYNITIVDGNLIPVPPGFPGEICVSSPYAISPGYHNRPDETKDRFIDSSAMPQSHLPAGIPVYRTGDMGRLSAEDGTLTMLGRITSQDVQVKIRGQRVELDEIANTITRCSKKLISNSAVSWRPDSETLVAFIVYGRETDQAGMDWARHDLRKQLPLPPYMCPTVWIPIPAIPLNANGKIDRRRIDEYPITSSDSVAPERLNGGSLIAWTGCEEQVAEIWSQVLGDKALDIAHSNADFFYLGGNSRNLIELRLLLERQFPHTKIQLPALFQHSSLRAMAALVASTDETGPSLGLSNQPALLDWNKEIVDACEEALRPHSLETLSAQTKATNREARNNLVVVLTGATGFLGRSIAQGLVDDDRVSEVHCIAIRGGDSKAPRVPIQSSKIIEYAGSLESPLLGLSDTDFNNLSKRADVIIHNAAQVSFLKTYHSLRQSNVSASIELCRMALVRHIPLHFVSSASVGLVPAKDSTDDSKPFTLAEGSASGRMPTPTSHSGYRDTKWVVEQVLEALNAQFGLPVVIHRPTSIVGVGAPKLDLMAAILNTSRTLGKVPALEGKIEGPLDLVSVQDVSSRLVAVVLDHGGNKAVKFVHHSNATKLEPGRLKNYLEEQSGLETTYSLVSLDEWLDAAPGAGMDPLLHDFLKVSFTGDNKIYMPLLV